MNHSRSWLSVLLATIAVAGCGGGQQDSGSDGEMQGMENGEMSGMDTVMEGANGMADEMTGVDDGSMDMGSMDMESMLMEDGEYSDELFIDSMVSRTISERWTWPRSPSTATPSARRSKNSPETSSGRRTPR